MDSLDIKSIDEKDRLILYFSTTTENTPSEGMYEFLATLYPDLQFDIQRIQFFEIIEFKFKNGKITKHIYEYIDDGKTMRNGQTSLAHYRADYRKNTLQVVGEQYF